ncbi:MFS transporter [Streptosporangium sp. NBC_01639]|uniref:MFS transporter n=1 Tax=Streptosporangium sp. NBC_01639 TaxID=2975948 RepID=UPI0038661379|nr:MFS transporter [Streptosporangium sp. NBC_01639]
MTSPGSLRSRRFLIFSLAAAALTASFMLTEPTLPRSGPEPRIDRLDVITLNEAAGALVSILLGLPLGVLIDRVRRRRSIMVMMALLGAVAVASVTVADGLGATSRPHIIAVMTVMTALAVVAPAIQDAYLPSLVGRERLVPANALLSVLPQILLLSLMPVLSLLDEDAFAFLVVVGVAMAVAALLFRSVDAAEEPPPPRVGLCREMAEGIRFTVKHPVLRAIILYLVVSALLAELVDEATDEALSMALDSAATEAPLEFYQWSVMVPLYGAPLLGALLAVLLCRRFGAFRLAWSAVLVSQPFTLLLALSGTDQGGLWYAVGRFVPLTGTIVVAIALLSHRQAITPDRLLGRVGGLLFVLTGLAGSLGDLLETPAEWLAGIGGSTPAPLTLLPGLALATVATLAAVVPLLRARHLATGPVSETTAAQ